MNRPIQSIFICGLVLFLGVVCGKLVRFPNSPKTVTPDVALADSSVEEFDLTDSPFDVAGVEEDLFPNGNAVTAFVSSSTVLESDQVLQARGIIRTYFPTLDDATVDGWAESYASLPIDDLRALLEQKQQLPDILPASSLPKFELELPEKTSVQQFARNIEVCLRNLCNADTIGFRAERQFAILSASLQSSTATVRDPRQGQQIATGNAFDLAIDEQDRMFVLHPGPVFTRCGRFQRLTDGSIGIIRDEQELFLDGTKGIPKDATEISVASDGTIHIGDESEESALEKVRLAVVPTLQGLHTTDGVFFTLNSDVEPPMTDNASIRSGYLELSNVKRSEEWSRLKHYRNLQLEFAETVAHE